MYTARTVTITRRAFLFVIVTHFMKNWPTNNVYRMICVHTHDRYGCTFSMNLVITVFKNPPSSTAMAFILYIQPKLSSVYSIQYLYGPRNWSLPRALYLLYFQLTNEIYSIRSLYVTIDFNFVWSSRPAFIDTFLMLLFLHTYIYTCCLNYASSV